MAIRKRFDRTLYTKYDALAKEATTHYLTGQGYTVNGHPNRYAQDLIFGHFEPAKVYDLDTVSCAECEVKLVWNGETFPYDTVQLPERKKKFFNAPTRFFIWNSTLTTAATFWSNDIKDLEPVEVPNKYVYKGEYFYQIPLDMVTFVTIQHNLELPTP